MMDQEKTISIPDPQVPEKAQRRRFSAEYKLRILEKVEDAQPGEIGSLLRREGLYSSHLAKWRKQSKEGRLQALSKKRGRKPRLDAQPDAGTRIAKLERENERLRRKLTQAETIIDVQKKLSQALGITSPDLEEKS
jgi:transposase-like protein